MAQFESRINRRPDYPTSLPMKRNLGPKCYVFRYRILKPASNEMIHKNDTNDEDDEDDENCEDDENDENGEDWLLSRITL